MNIAFPLLLISACWLTPVSICAQNFNVQLSERHMGRIDKGKNARDRLKLYYKLYKKDSARQIRKLNKYYQKKTDSLFRVNLANQRLCQKVIKNDLPCRIDTPKTFKAYTSVLSRDSMLLDPIGKEVTVHARDELIEQLPPAQSAHLGALQTQYGAQSIEVRKYLTVLRDSVSLIDTLRSVAMQKGGAVINEIAKNRLLQTDAFQRFKEYDKALGQLKSATSGYKKTTDQLQKKDSLQSEAQEKLKEEASEMIAGNLEKKMKPVQEKMALLKKKYSSLLNSNDLSTGVKARSLEGSPLRQRWVVGGNFSIPCTSPFMLDLSPQLGYKVDKVFQLGLGGVYRTTFTDSVKASNAPPGAVYGYSVWGNYNLVYGFFGYAEWERASREVKKATVDKLSRMWVDNLLIGVGRRFMLHRKINGLVLFLYNPLHENGKSIYPSAFVIKTGFQLSELALLKR